MVINNIWTAVELNLCVFESKVICLSSLILLISFVKADEGVGNLTDVSKIDRFVIQVEI